MFISSLCFSSLISHSIQQQHLSRLFIQEGKSLLEKECRFHSLQYKIQEVNQANKPQSARKNIWLDKKDIRPKELKWKPSITTLLPFKQESNHILYAKVTCCLFHLLLLSLINIGFQMPFLDEKPLWGNNWYVAIECTI